MALHEAVFVPDERHHQDIEDGEDDESCAVRV
jgi:hypothetical protein